MMTRRHCRLLPLAILLLLPWQAASSDTLTPATPLAGNRTLVSAGGTFALGFFTPDPATGRTYLGIWYNSIPARTVVWVANRDAPVLGPASLSIDANGSLAVAGEQGTVAWESPVVVGARGPTAQLLDSGNLVLRSANCSGSAGVAWQSFDYPTDTLLPGMKLGVDLRTGLDWRMSSWRGADDPSSPGEYSFRLDPRGSPELFLYRRSARTYGSGPWNGYQFAGVPSLRPNNGLLAFRFVSTPEEAYYTYEVAGGSDVLVR